MQPDAENVIECPLCGLPHRSSAHRCEACDQDLRSTPAFPELRAELRERQRNMMLGGVGIVAMIVLNVALFGGAGSGLGSLRHPTGGKSTGGVAVQWRDQNR